MFCSNCGFEYTQKTNYCKKCGGNLSSPEREPVTKLPGLKITGVFFVIAAFVLFSLMTVFDFYEDMINRGIRGPDAVFPFALGVLVIGVVAVLLTWLLSKVIGVTRKLDDRSLKQERPSFPEFQSQGQLISPTDPTRSVVESPSVVEHTTRQMSGVYQSPSARE